MNRLGMLVDLSHVSPDDDATTRCASRRRRSSSRTPPPRALCDHPRNVPDDVLRRVRDERRRGDGDVRDRRSSRPRWRASQPLWKEYEARSKQIQDPKQPRSCARRCWRGCRSSRSRSRRSPTTSSTCGRSQASSTWGSAATTTATTPGPRDSRTSRATRGSSPSSSRRGWSDEDLGRLASGNILRVLREAETVASRLQQARPASNATIEELDGPR